MQVAKTQGGSGVELDCEQIEVEAEGSEEASEAFVAGLDRL